jgi:hypothetical protein
VIFYVRKNKNCKSLEWIEIEYDEKGKEKEIKNGIEIGITTNISRIEIEYF